LAAELNALYNVERWLRRVKVTDLASRLSCDHPYLPAFVARAV
jgi:hypothetical protein